MLYQISGRGTSVSEFNHSDNTFYNNGRDVPPGGLADPSLERGFRKDDPQLVGGAGQDYKSWMGSAVLKAGSPSRGRGAQRAIKDN